MPRVSVIVPARDAAGTLPRTLDALAAQDLGEPYEVLVADDGSSDGTPDLARAAAGEVVVLEQPPSGPGAARNLAVGHSSGSILAFCDADVFPTPGWLRAGVAALEEADLVQGHVLPDPTAAIGPFDRSLWITHEVGLYQTANLFTTRETFDRVGGFHDWLVPEFGIPMAEDVLFGWSARRAGARSRFCAEALAHHAVFPRTWGEYAAERRRLRYFPRMAAKVPELREHFLYRRWFLSRRSACFDVALAGVGAALTLRSPLPLLAAAPYARMVRSRARGFGGRAIEVAGADVVADLTGLAAMARGSIAYRSPVL